MILGKIHLTMQREVHEGRMARKQSTGGSRRGMYSSSQVHTYKASELSEYTKDDWKESFNVGNHVRSLWNSVNGVSPERTTVAE